MIFRLITFKSIIEGVLLCLPHTHFAIDSGVEVGLDDLQYYREQRQQRLK